MTNEKTMFIGLHMMFLPKIDPLVITYERGMKFHANLHYQHTLNPKQSVKEECKYSIVQDLQNFQ